MPGMSSRDMPASARTVSSSGDVVEGVSHHRNGSPRPTYDATSWRARSAAVSGANRAPVTALNIGNGTSECAATTSSSGSHSKPGSCATVAKNDSRLSSTGAMRGSVMG